MQLIPLLQNVKKQKGIYVSGKYQWGHILSIQSPKQGVYVVALGTEEYGGQQLMVPTLELNADWEHHPAPDQFSLSSMIGLRYSSHLDLTLKEKTKQNKKKAPKQIPSGI